MADYWVCSDCGQECEVMEISDNGEERSECCGAIANYRTTEDHGDWDRDFGLDTDIDY